jgi:hypothetical protein
MRRQEVFAAPAEKIAGTAEFLWLNALPHGCE